MKLVSVLRRLQSKKQQRESTEGKEVVEENKNNCKEMWICAGLFYVQYRFREQKPSWERHILERNGLL